MDALEKLEEKINRALALIEKLTGDNKVLREENDRLRKEVAETRSKLSDLERQEQSRSENVKERLGNILSKLESLEKIS